MSLILRMRHLVAMKGKPMKPAKDRRRKSSNRSSTQIVPITSKQRKPEKSWKSTLEALKATQKPYRGLNQLARPADTRRKIQDMSDVGRAQKRKKLMEEHDACPRHGGQSFLEQAAVSPRTAKDDQFRIAVFHQFCCLSKLSIRSAPQIDTCLTIFFEQCFKDGMSINEVTKFLAAIIDFETRAITKTHVGPLASCSQGMAQLGSRNLSPTRSLAGGSTSGIQDGGGQQGDPCPVHPNYVCNVLPSFRTSYNSKEGT